MDALDGNAIAGELFAEFGVDMTVVRGRCRSCSTTSQIAELRVYMRAPGAVARCPGCGGVVMVIVEAREGRRVDMSAFELEA
ncbi:MAG TPA: DUF6510 family protein [Thermoleophilaceae bacterium]